MSAIRNVIEAYRRECPGNSGDRAALAAEAELQQLLDGNARYTEALERLVERRHEAEKRDRADAEFLSVLRDLKDVWDSDRFDMFSIAISKTMAAFERWAAAKGGKSKEPEPVAEIDLCPECRGKFGCECPSADWGAKGGEANNFRKAGNPSVCGVLLELAAKLQKMELP